jgi:hypothetical protein
MEENIGYIDVNETNTTDTKEVFTDVDDTSFTGMKNPMS